ncbi:MAG TPA: glutamate-1-semialdehyde 2,1-aminomutase [Phycisphaerae bacterium]|nr:glutamate-1-semialdehyde 2,1-aminomutase [Phycisphaerae bacterium]
MNPGPSQSDKDVRTAESRAAFERARLVLPGGVDSPVRAFGAVGGTPIFISKAKGAILTDVDGNEYVDYLASWGPLILGHADDRVAAAISKALSRGSSFGAPCELETQLAELIVAAVPSIELVRFVNSGTEATASAVRLARAFAGRDLIVKCEGCYHGHVDCLLTAAGSGATTFGVPSSPGIPASVTRSTLLVPFNHLQAAEAVFGEHGSRIACVIVEPIAGNMGCIPPADGYLDGLRQLCDRHGALLIFDEVISGFRVDYGGAQRLYGVRPDLTCLGKIIGGGLPVGAYGGRREIMQQVSPSGPVYQAGTLSGNPLAMAAGLATLQVLAEDGVYERLDRLAERLTGRLCDAARNARVDVQLNRVGSMWTVFFCGQPVTDYASALRCNTEHYAAYFHAMLSQGVYLAPSQFESAFVSTAHDDEHIERTVVAAEHAFSALAGRDT